MVAADHGSLCTRHAGRGVDAVPACFVLHDHLVAVPVDTVKPKGSTRLQRSVNLDEDPRAALLVERWDPDDWSALWWVRASLERVEVDAHTGERLEVLLAGKYRQYRDRPFADVLVFSVVALAGWSAR